MKNRLSHQLVTLSDVHITSPSDPKTLLFLDLLERIDRDQVEYLLLTGDIFDFFLGNTPYYKKKYSAIGKALTKISQGKTQILFMQGNHEFALKKLNWQGVHSIEDPEYSFRLSSGERFMITHGDSLVAPKAYHIYKFFIRQSWVPSLVSKLPQNWLDAICIKLAHHSRLADEFKVLKKEAVKKAVEDWLAPTQCDYAIIGHFHVPFDFYCKKGSCRLLSVHSWEKPNVLTFNNKKIFRSYFTHPGENYQLQPMT